MRNHGRETERGDLVTKFTPLKNGMIAKLLVDANVILITF